MNEKQQIIFAKMAQAAIDQVGELFGQTIAENSPMPGLISCGNIKKEDQKRRYYVVLATNDEATRLKEWFDQTLKSHLEAMKKAWKKNGDGVHIDVDPKDWPA